MGPLLAALLVAAAPAPSPIASPDPCAGLLAQMDRPTIGFSTCAVKARTAVLEEGYQHLWNGDASNPSSQAEAPQGFERIGIAPQLELDLIGPNNEWQRGVTGFADSGLGFKYEILPQGNATFAIDGLYTAPNGAADFTEGNASYTLNLDAGYQLTPATSFAATVAFGSTGGFGDNGMHSKYGTLTPSGLVLEQINALTEIYVEYVDVSRVSPDIGNRAFMDTGLQRLLGNNFEIDVEFGHALTGDPALRFNYVGAGLGVLIH